LFIVYSLASGCFAGADDPDFLNAIGMGHKQKPSGV
jgi:hypothetical protein